MSGVPKGERHEPIASLEQLSEYFRSGEKPRDAWRVGTEHEKIGLRAEDLLPIPYEGERGIRAVLEALAEASGWTRVFEDETLVALEREGTSITLEPGGQLELSGAPLRTIHETCREFHRHLDEVRQVSAPLGLTWLSVGINPLYDVDQIPRMPKRRYTVMRDYLPSKGDLAMHMMHATATVQANLDFSSEADMARKMRTAMGVSPIVSALFANSSIAAGKPTGFVSKRMHIWRFTDPDRCGLLPFVFEPDFGYRHYAEWALDVPMFFVYREGAYLPARGRSFRSFLEQGFEGHRASLADWELHLTTLFPEVRLKRFIEMRGADGVPALLICALPALWKGILYDDQALAASWELVADWAYEEREAALEAVARRGLAARVAGREMVDLARELVAIASEGLRRIGHAGLRDPDERGYLDPLVEIAARGSSPGQEILASWEGAWARSPRRLIEYARY